MKKSLLILTIVGTITLTNAQWLTPSNTICKDNGGEISVYGTCKASWENAQKICAKHDAKLPTIEALKKVASTCKSKEKSNDLYMKCYKNHGFTGSSSYWSSTSDKKYPQSAYGMNFYSAAATAGSKTYAVDIRCIK